MAKKGCFLAGCAGIFILLIVAAIFFVWVVGPPKPMTVPQKEALSSDLALPAGTVLKDGTAIVVLVDTSGSMKETVTDADGTATSKIKIAQRVTRKTFDEISDYASKNPDRAVYAGLTRFSGQVSEVIPLSPMNPMMIGPAIDGLTATGSTAIGDAMVAAKMQLNRVPLKKQFMIVITDGVNTDGRPPEDVVATLQTLPQEQRPSLYLVAFDIQAKKFEPLIHQGVTVSEANDALSLQSALDYILYEKILVEQE